MDYTTSRMDIHYISLSYCVALSICRFFLVYPFCQVMPFHLLPVNATDEPVKLIRCKMPCGITFPGPAEAVPDFLQFPYVFPGLFPAVQRHSTYA